MPRTPEIKGRVGRALREIRESAGLTQEKLSHRASLHATYVSTTENGKRNISVAALERWLRACDFKWEEFGRLIDGSNGKG